MKHALPAIHFAVFRIIFGTYLAIHFAMLIPYANELFGATGTVPDKTLLPTAGIFPNILSVFDSTNFVIGFICFLTFCAGIFTAGIFRPIVSLILWYGWACLFNRNIFIGNPGIPMVGWLLLACSLIPTGEPWALGKKQNQNWEMPRVLFWGAWAIMAVGYTVSGLHKLGSPSWVDGSAILRLLENPLARDNFLREFLLHQTPWVTKIMTYASLAMEILFLPLALFSKTRPWIWLAMVGMHLGILVVVDFADLTFCVLMMHLFTFDPNWLSRYVPTQRSTN